MGSMLIALPSSSASAQQPPEHGCFAVSKQEFKRSKNRKPYLMSYGKYVRTGRFWWRYYWYCPYRQLARSQWARTPGPQQARDALASAKGTGITRTMILKSNIQVL
jgi:hypothetical protein